LVAVIAQGERLFEAAGDWREAAEMVDPRVIGEAIEADARGPGLVAVTQDMGGEARGGDRVEELRAELGVAAGGVHLGVLDEILGCWLRLKAERFNHEGAEARRIARKRGVNPERFFAADMKQGAGS
jgi:hypothetical protein